MINIRRATPADAERIIACLKDLRGEYYDSKRINVDSIKDESRFISLVAEDEHGNFAGTVSAFFGIFADEPLEIGMLAIDPGFGGHGLARLLSDASYKERLEHGTPALKAHIVTCHSKVQTMCESQGFVPSGFLLGMRDRNLCCQYEARRADKNSLCLYTLKDQKDDAGTLYLSELYEDFAREVYDALGVRYEVRRGEHLEDSGTSEINYKRDDYHKILYAEVMSAASDIAGAAAEMAAECRATPGKTAQVFLKINDPHAPDAAQEFIKSGFMFTGFDPLTEHGEFMVLFYQNGVELALDDMVLTSRNKEILAEVRNIDYQTVKHDSTKD